MSRMLLPGSIGVAMVTALVAPALAEKIDNHRVSPRGQPMRGTSRVVVDTPLEMFTAAEPQVSPHIYLNRCSGGCQIIGGEINDARTNTSTIPANGTHMVAEYRNAGGQTGAAADQEWNEVVKCIKEVYSPFNVMVSDQKPPGGVSYTMAVIAGVPGNIGLPNDILGIAPLAGDCSPQDNVISFSFANHHGNTDRVLNLCWTAAQETAHALGLDHQYMFSDGTSACNDPMTYRFDCGGQRFFRNKPASCGEDMVRPCRCGGSQNSHLKIKNVFGDGQSLIPAPTCSIITPMGGTVTNGQIVAASAGSRRGVAKVELWINGSKWDEKPGAAFLGNGQPNPSTYTTMLPGGVPDGVMDLVVKAYDDLGLKTDSATVRVQKGAPCTQVNKCAEGQLCDAEGRCYWEPPTGQLGDTCEYSQFCTSGVCTETSEGSFCSQDCILGAADSCPAGFECIPTGGSTGQCLEATESGCCSVGSGESVWVHLGISALVLGLVVRRRRRR